MANPGGRKFNVDINGKRVLSDFDKAKALTKDFTSISPDETGHVVIALTRGAAGQPLISGIEIFK